MTNSDIEDRDLCIWAWAAAQSHILTDADNGYWNVRVYDTEDDTQARQIIRVPTGSDHMPDFAHPDWPAARIALQNLRISSETAQVALPESMAEVQSDQPRPDHPLWPQNWGTGASSGPLN